MKTIKKIALGAWNIIRKAVLFLFFMTCAIVQFLYFLIMAILFAVVINPFLVWTIASISKGTAKWIKNGSDLDKIADRLGLTWLYRPFLKRVPLSRKQYLGGVCEMDLSYDEEFELAKRYGAPHALEIAISDKTIWKMLENERFCSQTFAAVKDRWSFSARLVDAVLTYSQNYGDVSLVISKTTLNLEQARKLLWSGNSNLLLQVAERQTFGSVFLKDIKKENPALYAELIEMIDDKANAKFIEEKSEDEVVEMLKKNLNLKERAQKALLKKRDIDYIKAYFEAKGEVIPSIILSLSENESNFATKVWKLYFANGYGLSEQEKVVLKQGPHYALVMK